MSTIIERAMEIRAIMQNMLKTAADEDILQAPMLADNWSEEAMYEANAVVRYNNIPYRCLQGHSAQASWNPVDAPSLWARILTQEGQILPWEQPDSTNPYMIGDKVSHNDKTWESTVDNNVWEPGVYGWQEV